MPKYPITDYVIGLDLGRDRDYSAIAVLGVRLEDSGPFDSFRLIQPTRRILEAGDIHRVPLGTEYLNVIRNLRRLVSKLHAAAGWGAAAVRIHLIIDSAGPGQVALELIRAQRMNINFVPALLTAGHESGYSAAGKVTIPRREIIANLRYMLEVKIVRLHRQLPLMQALKEEIAAVRPGGGQNAHDDLVIAASLATWYATRVYPDIIRPRIAA